MFFLLNPWNFTNNLWGMCLLLYSSLPNSPSHMCPRPFNSLWRRGGEEGAHACLCRCSCSFPFFLYKMSMLFLELLVHTFVTHMHFDFTFMYVNYLIRLPYEYKLRGLNITPYKNIYIHIKFVYKLNFTYAKIPFFLLCTTGNITIRLEILDNSNKHMVDNEA